MPLILILSGNFFVLILSLIGAQASYFKACWKWFVLSMLCAVISGGCIGVEVYQVLTPPSHDMTIVVRQPTTPL